MHLWEHFGRTDQIALITCLKNLNVSGASLIEAYVPARIRPNLPAGTGTKISQRAQIKNLLMPLFLMGCFPVDFQEVKRPLETKSGNRPIKVGKRPINEGKRPIKAKVLVGVSVGCLMGCFRAPQPWRKTAPLKRHIKRSMTKDQKNSRFRSRLKISIENEIFERATHRGPIFCGEVETSRLKFSSEIKNIDRDWNFRSRSNFLIVGPSGPLFQTMCFRDPAAMFYYRHSVLLSPSWITMTAVFLVRQGP